MAAASVAGLPNGDTGPEDTTAFDGKRVGSCVNCLAHTQLSCMDHDLCEIPATLADKFGAQTIQLNLSWNCLTDLQNLTAFPLLEELHLDNNCLGPTLLATDKKVTTSRSQCYPTFTR